MPPPIAHQLVIPDCPVRICREYVKSLNLNVYFRKEFDCFCARCRTAVRQKTYNVGDHDYTIPYGWVRFRIKTDDVQTRVKQIFRQWTTSYYGTWEENLERILRNREMPFPGDHLLDGTTFVDHSRDRVHCFTSPSIKYTSNWQRSPVTSFTPTNGRCYNVQIILQCKQKPETFTIQPGASGFCDVIPANVIEWKSKQRATIIPNGLMVRIVPK